MTMGTVLSRLYFQTITELLEGTQLNLGFGVFFFLVLWKILVI